jgi:uncharacterized membrane protein YphA (DoxX/SURF4 family)
MRPNPIADAINFVSGSALFYVFALLVIASLIIAAVNLVRDAGQRNIKDIATYVLRFFIGCMWWQQTLWKLPPTYTDLPDGSGGLRYWVAKMVDGAAFSLQSDFVQYVVQPNFLLFAPIVYATEVFIGVSLITGTAVRLSGVVGAAMAVNLWLGLYSTHGEWPWTYFFLIVIQLMFALYRAGRSLGVDGLIAYRLQESPGEGGLRSRILALIT